MNKDRNWTVLFIGGASGTGKSSLAYEIARFYGVNVLEVDDIHLSVEAVTTKEGFPAIHYWNTGVNWMEVGVERNVNWLIDVSKEMIPVLKELVNRHLEDKVPVIIEGDFIYPEFILSFDTPEVKSIFVNESDINQILQNYLSREGGDLQHYRAGISISYGKWIADICNRNNIRLIDSRPWNTVLTRALNSLL
ncbi:2-phosphoglycerate kinase [Anaerotaenia torta]|uniref:hypothetical protein n=1 Tax=Anaerotaenia torta TaxID=433293 RepID=UPI003D23976B